MEGAEPEFEIVWLMHHQKNSLKEFGGSSSEEVDGFSNTSDGRLGPATLIEVAEQVGPSGQKRDSVRKWTSGQHQVM